MLSSKFVAELWKEALGPWSMKFGPFNHCSELFSNWKGMYHDGTVQNPQIKDAWLVMPKLICWHIWLERNQRIFKDKKSASKITWVKIKSHLKDCMGDQINRIDLTEQEILWGASLDLQFSDKVKAPSPPLKPWQIHLKDTEFAEFCIKKARKSLFFYGASKGNPSKSGAGGVIKSVEGRTEARYAWGVGINTSIQAEALALLQGLKVLKTLGIKDAVVFGDSQTIIKAIVDNSSPSDLRLSRLLSRINSLTYSFQNLEFLHIKRDNNKYADAKANKAVLLPLRNYIREREEGWDPIP